MLPEGGVAGPQQSQFTTPPTVNPGLVPSMTISGGRWVTTGGIPRVTIAHSNC